MTLVYIGLGSNLDDPRQQLDLAFQALAKIPQTSLVTRSSLYVSQPMGPQDQAKYVNAVALLDSALSAQQMLAFSQQIENQQGRLREGKKWGPRTLDLDILLFGQQIIQSDELTIPHYGMKTREFVLYPLYEIAADLVLPDGDKLENLVLTTPLNGMQKIVE